ncbi:Cation/H+ exchanger [Corchorus capsularis]|uniref:Cation/H+ exchanger n=1 Tax=Corchorus capsularis TaxID=210143 RepID=A0A1R3JDT4_COCAP|nr:Cation/H+ exchanger [Corchorus capsularis]
MAHSNDSFVDMTGIEGKVRQEHICIEFPSKVSSPGLASFYTNNIKLDAFMDYSGPRLYLQMVASFVLTQSIHTMALKYLGFPMLISQVLAGVILGPMLFHGHNSLITMSESSIEVLGTIGSLGFVFYLFLSGVKMDTSMTRTAGWKAISIGSLTVLVPFVFCLITDVILNGGHRDMIKNKNFFLAMTYSTTSFPVIHSLLNDLKILNSELGRLGLAAALVSDLLSMAILNIGKYFKTYVEKEIDVVLREIGLNVAFVIIVFYVMRPTMNWMVKRTPDGGKIKDVFVYAVIFMLMMIPTVTGMTHLFVLVGPFMLGLAVPDGPPLGSALVEKLEPFVSGLLLPFFASACGMRFNVDDIINISPYAKSQSIAAVVTLFVKFLVSLALPLLCKMPTSDSLALALIMTAKGLFEIGSYSILFDVGMISADIFSTNFVIIVLLASVTPFLVKKFYDPSRKYIGYQKRSILHAKVNENLKIIGCIHVPGNVNSIINLLDSLYLTKETPITLDVLHLVKLTGRATPLLITHSKNSKTMPTKSYSENVILAFNQFERNNWGALFVNIFIAISPSNLMYEDVCNLAMKQLTSFIILPFHRRWYIDGSIESENVSIRNLNQKMLERAPCSVGILVEGRQTTKCSNSNSIEISSSLPSIDKIAVIFLGGKDDREALALAKRMSQDQEVNITVIHLKIENDYAATLVDSEKMLDDETLRFMNQTTYVTYIEHYVNEGTETSDYLKSIVDKFQLIIVGRRYKKDDNRTSGLEQWSEFQEIGVLGDLLASSDFSANFSLLIVQQQLRIYK